MPEVRFVRARPEVWENLIEILYEAGQPELAGAIALWLDCRSNTVLIPFDARTAAATGMIARAAGLAWPDEALGAGTDGRQ